MVVLGYHASHEQVPPSGLLLAVVEAERAGFDAAFSSDHLAPWTRDQGHSGSALAWVGAALASTRLPIGVVSTPGQRYHPVVVAHAMATFAEMFPGRFFAALGSGENLNEHVTGDPWPPKDERTARLGECVDVIRRLLAGEEVTHEGRVRVDRARLWSLPEVPPPMRAAAATARTAAWAAGWAQGLVTVGTDVAAVAEIVRSYREAGGAGPVALQVHLALAGTEPEAMALVREQWRHAVVLPPDLWDLATPEDFEQRSRDADDDELREHVLVATDVATAADRLAALVTGADLDEIYLHEISQDQPAFLNGPARELLRAVRERLEGGGT